MLKISFFRKSVLTSNSELGIFQFSPVSTSGKHALASSLKSPLSMLCSARMTCVIVSKSESMDPRPTISMTSTIGDVSPFDHFRTLTLTKTSSSAFRASSSSSASRSSALTSRGKLNAVTRDLGRRGSTGVNDIIGVPLPGSIPRTSSFPTIFDLFSDG